jgi:heat shock protein HslJ
MRLVSIFLLLTLAIMSCQSTKTNITGTEWKLIRMQATDYSTLAKPVTLIINPDDTKISGFGGCNSYFGTVALEGDHFTVSGVGSTKMYCDETMETEDTYFRLLQQVDHFAVKDNTLQLLEEGKVLLEFTR